MTINTIDQSYYDEKYFVDPIGKTFTEPDGSESSWGYKNPEGEWLGCAPIVDSWKKLFSPHNMLDVGFGRGTFLTYARDVGIEAVGFDYSDWAVNNLYPRCSKEWVIQHDATQPWPYQDNQFDFVTVLDLFEHIYTDDIEFVINEMCRVSKKWIFIQIATIGHSTDHIHHNDGCIIKKNEPVPLEFESTVVPGHVTVQYEPFWLDKLIRPNYLFRRDLIHQFCEITPADVIANWTSNLILVMEKVR